MKNPQQELNEQIATAVKKLGEEQTKRNQQYVEQLKNERLEKFIEYLFPSDHIDETFRMQFDIDNSPMQLTQRKQHLKKNLKELKYSKNKNISVGHLGQSLYIKIFENNNIILEVRISYHRPNIDYGQHQENRNTIAFLCIDALSANDEEKAIKGERNVYVATQSQNRRNNKTIAQIKNDATIIYADNHIINDHEDRVLYECIHRSKMTYLYLGKDDYNSIQVAIKTFIEGQGVIVEALQNDFTKYDVKYELVDDID